VKINMKINIRKTEQGDIDYILANPLEEAVKTYPKMHIPETSYTAVDENGKVIGIGGLTVFWEGVAEAWMVLSKDILDYRISAYRHIKEVIALAFRHFKLRRIQVTVRKDFPQAKKMFEQLDFKEEGFMEQFLPDKMDAYLFAKVINNEQK